MASKNVVSLQGDSKEFHSIMVNVEFFTVYFNSFTLFQIYLHWYKSLIFTMKGTINEGQSLNLFFICGGIHRK